MTNITAYNNKKFIAFSLHLRNEVTHMLFGAREYQTGLY